MTYRESSSVSSEYWRRKEERPRATIELLKTPADLIPIPNLARTMHGNSQSIEVLYEKSMEENAINMDKPAILYEMSSVDSSSSSDPNVVSNKTIDMSSLELNDDQRDILHSAFVQNEEGRSSFSGLSKKTINDNWYSDYTRR